MNCISFIHFIHLHYLVLYIFDATLGIYAICAGHRGLFAIGSKTRDKANLKEEDSQLTIREVLKDVSEKIKQRR